MTDRGIFILTLNGKILNLHRYGNAVFELYKEKDLLVPHTYGGFQVYKNFSTNIEEKIYYNMKDVNTARSIRNSINTGNEVYLASRDRGLFVYKDGKSISLNEKKQFKSLYPTQLHYVQEKEKLYVGTMSGDIYIASIKDTFIIEDSIKHKEIIGNKIKFIQTWKDFVIAGTNVGINIIDKHKTIRFIDQEQGVLDKEFSCSVLDNDNLFVYTETGGYYLIPMKEFVNWGDKNKNNNSRCSW